MANPRKLAVSALLKVNNDSAYSNITLNNVFKTADVSREDKALTAAVFYGVLDRKITLDYVLNSLMKTPFKKVAPYTAEVLRTGLYQIMFMEKTPDSAAVNEAVKLIKNSKESRNSGFVNAVLRSAIRAEKLLPDGDKPEDLSIRYSCPEWIIESFIKDYGIDDTKAFLEESLKPAPLCIRVNTVKISTDELQGKLLKDNIETEKCNIENALIIKKGIDISNNLLYKNGFFHVEDTASQISVSKLDLKPGESVLDICAAPGGKSFTMAETMNNDGTVISCDIYKQKVNLIEDGKKRLGLDIIKPTVNDGTVFNTEFPEFDAVLCDVPCSGLGIIRRKPDIKYKPKSDFSELKDIQYNILCNSSRYLKKGGRLLYSTCTLRKEENGDIIKKFIKEHNGYKIMYEYTYMPHKDNTDGFYCSLISKDNL